MIAATVLIPIAAAGLSLSFASSRFAQRIIAGAALSLTTAFGVAVLLAVETDPDGIITTRVGGWDPTLGIVLVADLTGALFLLISLITIAAVAVYAIAQPNEEDTHGAFHPVYLVLTAGVALAFTSGDLFSLFVAFELTLVASYVLLTLGGRADQVRTGITYVTLNLIASALFLAAIAGVYAAVGSVNLATIAQRWTDLPGHVDTGLGLALLGAFGIKAGVFPLFSWLPDAYPAAPTSVTAIFAGLLTKIGVYAIVRVHSLLSLDQLGPVIGAVAALTMVVGVLGALAQDDMKRILSFHIVSQIGYKLVGVALATTAGLAATVVFIVHQIPVKTALLLTGGLVEQRHGTGRLDRLSGLVRTSPGVAALFALGALSLAGLPPLSGFVAKLAVIDAAAADASWLLMVTGLVVGGGTLLSMTKIWTGAFWGASDGDVSVAVPARPDGTEVDTGRRASYMTAATAGLVGVTVLVAMAAGPLVDLAYRAAEALVDPAGYIEAVLS